MSETIDHAREGIEHAHEAAEGHRHEPFAIRVAVLVSMLAAALAIVELGEKSSQAEFLTQNIVVVDDYAYYQAKTLRSSTLSQTMDVLQSLPTAQDPAVRVRIDAMQTEQKRLDDDEKTQGRKQILEAAKRHEEARDHFGHLYHSYERAVGLLQISIVLASVSVVTRIHPMAWAAAAVGGAAVIYAGLTATGMLV
jgi:hypothetical protein